MRRLRMTTGAGVLLLALAPAACDLKPAVAPGVAGVWNEATPGRLRFAAAAPGGVGDGPVLTLRFTGQAALTRESFTLAMEEVVARDGFANVTRLVATAAHPLLVQGVHAKFAGEHLRRPPCAPTGVVECRP